MYELIPNNFIAVLFPVNESIFEHMKIIFSATLIYGVIDYLLIKLNNIEVNNFLGQLFISSFLGIFIFLVMYLPVHFLVGEYLILTLVLLFITYVIIEIISYYMLKSREFKLLERSSIILIIIVYFILGYYTFNPPHNYFFYDTLTNSYGINKNKN